MRECISAIQILFFNTPPLFRYRERLIPSVHPPTVFSPLPDTHGYINLETSAGIRAILVHRWYEHRACDQADSVAPLPNRRIDAPTAAASAPVPAPRPASQSILPPLHMNLNAQGSDRWNTTSSSSSSSTNKVSCGYSATTSTLATSPPLTAQANTTPVLATNYPLPIVFVLGGPGSGKGTQCDILVNTHGFEQICAGSLLRNEAARGTELGDMIKGIINRGDIVPGHITIGLLQREIDECVAKMDLQVQPALAEDYSNSVAPSPMQNVNAPKPIRGILIDGFPRALEQADEFEKAIGGDAIHLVLYFSCPIDVMRSRLRKRGETSGREDDVDEVIDKRFHTFLKTSLPVVDKYKKLGILREVEAIGSVDEIHEQVMEILKKEKI